MKTLLFVLKAIGTILAAVIAFLEAQGGNPGFIGSEAALERSLREAAQSILKASSNSEAS